ncbi:MAG: hypothetical protein RJA70_4298 [Pseudomonadota bacterium]|jgi:hypothetical protein
MRVRSLGEIAFAGLAASCYLACSSAGPYGHAKDYAPLGAEVDAASGAADYDPVMAGRQFDRWIGKSVSVFGVVKTRKELPDGSADLTLSIRTRQPRNLCESTDEETCRVTVGDHEFGVVHVSARLTPEDAEGSRRLGPGSLVRAIGAVKREVHAQTGNAVIAGQFYRHWPAGYYVTTQARAYMLR